MPDDQTPDESGTTPSISTPGTEPTSGPPTAEPSPDEGSGAPAPAKKTTRRRTTKKAPPASPEPSADSADQTADSSAEAAAEVSKPVAKKTTRKRAAKKTTAPPPAPTEGDDAAAQAARESDGGDPPAAPSVVFQPPPATAAPRRRPSKKASAKPAKASTDESTEESGAGSDGAEAAAQQAAAPERDRAPGEQPEDQEAAQSAPAGKGDAEAGDGEDGEGGEGGEGGQRRRRRRGGRRRRGRGSTDGDGPGADDSGPGSGDQDDDESGQSEDDSSDDDEGQTSSSSRRRRRRRRSGEGGDNAGDDNESGTRVRSAREAEDEITSFTGSTRLEAKKQRRREGREAGRRRAPVISEAEFLARRESVDRKMVVRQRGDLTQIAVLEDDVLVEHYVARESQTSLIGNVYLGKVQNVLPSMEAAFIDIGRGRNAVLYAGEVNWSALGAGGSGGKERKIEQVLKPGQAVLVQVTKDPVGHKGARLTSQISLPGRFLVFVPEGNTSGISRKLPDGERNRLKSLLKEIVPAEAGVIVRTAAEGAAEEELRRDVARLTARWEDIGTKVENGNAPQELYREPDLTLKVVRDLFTEDIGELVVSGDDAWDMVETYVNQVAPDLADRLTRHDDSDADAFAAYRIDEQISKALERKVWLPSGGSLVIDRTEAMTVVDVNTGKFTGSGGNLEETVTKNNLEAAEEFVRQLRLRDIGGIIVIDFIDMVLESNRELVLRRLIECLGRDRTRHQVAEVTSLGLVQMTRKRIGTGLIEAFSEPCEHCQGRGVHLHGEPVEQRSRPDDERRNRRNRRGKPEDGAGKGSKNAKDDKGKGRKGDGPGAGEDGTDPGARRPTPAEFAAMAARAAEEAEQKPEEPTTAPPPDATTPAAPEAERPTGPPAEQADDSVTPPNESAPPPTPVDSTPRIVTSVRRRGATRAAGPPSPEPATDGPP
jgi:ribonuclease E